MIPKKKKKEDEAYATPAQVPQAPSSSSPALPPVAPSPSVIQLSDLGFLEVKSF